MNLCPPLYHRPTRVTVSQGLSFLTCKMSQPMMMNITAGEIPVQERTERA